ncbi:DUF1266 domain-containing protein [Kitasatospora sp. NPDC056138]|uniref:DUF1266 domain-containing protein n=1 Tax=Kitasatospora sp. NPDC056138 TaxID=3345724 RepID=UPI0035E1BE52
MNSTGAVQWTPATQVEHELHEARNRGDLDWFLRMLASTRIYRDARLSSFWDDSDGVEMLDYRDATGRPCIAVRTRGELPAQRDEVGLVETGFAALAENWPGEQWHLVVNPGTPLETYLDSDAPAREKWRQLAEEAPQPGHDDDALVTRFTGPLQGPLAHALACGGHLAVHNQVPWNEIADVYWDYAEDVTLLSETWGCDTLEEWQEQLEHLIKAQNSPWAPEFVLRLRRNAVAQHKQALDPTWWRAAVSNTLTTRGCPAEEVEEAVEVIGRITRYEQRFRADGVLPPDGFVTSAVGYDYGRAVNFVRWGVGARFCTPETAERIVPIAGALVREHYDSWEEFSAGYLLGRVLRFDEEEFGHMYTSALRPHNILMSDPGSPWRNIPFS